MEHITRTREFIFDWNSGNLQMSGPIFGPKSVQFQGSDEHSVNAATKIFHFYTCCIPDVRTSRLPHVRTSGRPDVRTCGRPDVRTSGCPDVRTSRRPDVRTSRRPDVKTSGRLDVWTSGHPDVWTSGPRDVPLLRIHRTKMTI